MLDHVCARVRKGMRSIRGRLRLLVRHLRSLRRPEPHGHRAAEGAVSEVRGSVSSGVVGRYRHPAFAGGAGGRGRGACQRAAAPRDRTTVERHAPHHRPPTEAAAPDVNRPHTVAMGPGGEDTHHARGHLQRRPVQALHRAGEGRPQPVAPDIPPVATVQSGAESASSARSGSTARSTTTTRPTTSATATCRSSTCCRALRRRGRPAR